MLQKFDVTRTRAAVALTAATVVVGGFAVAWAGTGSSPNASAQLASSEAPGDVSGSCDEAEHADDPRCAGTTPADDGTSTTAPSDDGSSTTAPTSTAPTTPTGGGTGTPSGDVRTVTAADAGTVTYRVDGSTVTLLQATPTAGWRVEVEQASGDEIDLDFRSGTRRVQVDIEFEDGAVRERVRVRDDADDSRTEIVNGTVTEVEPGDDRDDDGDDDDRSGHDDEDDDDDDDDDRSGHGGDDDDDDDRSGHGGDDD